MSRYDAYRNVPTLSVDEQRHFRARGYVVPGWRLPTAQLLQIEDSLARLLFLHAFDQPAFIRQPHVPGQIEDQIDLAREFFDYLSHRNLCELVAPLLGPDVMLAGATLQCGWPSLESTTPWYQPGACWPVDADLLTCGIALDDLEPPVAGLRVRTGSSVLGPLPHQDEASDWPPQALSNPAPQVEAFSCAELALEAGQVVLLHGNLVQQSFATGAAERSALLLVHYFPTRQRFDRSRNLGAAAYADHPLWLVAGHAAEGQHDVDLGHTIW